ncbi:hypothetical protein VDBG_09612 [Verticillium alfalfae VaMs.102]|uniref:Uncharacterized protein n=1 Tax=Verticillium alfalfae (strain VaMs.102 / ATCC MYA-4576 / FGSC 10136) TaxID=526221 RepID=C9SWW1_VERA1|nr:hypothetical protein VDBG_09612 [Verticillium alfalfae VaMs.102]EEY23502.1 hypothetical protein VDBG_09612 [Verticillium alfalfae VaMs.102]
MRLHVTSLLHVQHHQPGRSFEIRQPALLEAIRVGKYEKGHTSPDKRPRRCLATLNSTSGRFSRGYATNAGADTPNRPHRYESIMNSLAQFTLLTVLSRGRFQGYENQIWNGSRASLPIVSPTKSNDRPVSQHASEERSEGRKQSDNGTSRHGRSNSAGPGSNHSGGDDAGSYLKGELYSAVLLAQSFVILGEIGLVGCSAVEETDDDGFESWNR